MRKRLLPALLIPLLCACPPQQNSQDQAQNQTESQSPASNQALQLSNTVTLTSKGFAPQGAIPARYTCQGENLSPPLLWANLPKGTRSEALIMDDPDAPGGVWLHWVLYNVPPEIIALPEGLGKTDTLALGALQGHNAFHKIGYDGPCPPAGPAHHYSFRIYALDKMLQIEPGASRADVEAAMQGHVLGQGELVGTFK